MTLSHMTIHKSYSGHIKIDSKEIGDNVVLSRARPLSSFFKHNYSFKQVSIQTGLSYFEPFVLTIYIHQSK